MTEELKTCKETVYGQTWSARNRPCGRKVSDLDPDNELCGVHLSAKNRRAAKDKAYDEAQVARRQEEARVQAIAVRLGGPMALHTEYQGASTGRVSTGAAIVSLTFLEALAQRIEDLETGKGA